MELNVHDFSYRFRSLRYRHITITRYGTITHRYRSRSIRDVLCLFGSLFFNWIWYGLKGVTVNRFDTGAKLRISTRDCKKMLNFLVILL